MKRKRIFSCFLTVMLVLVMAMPVFAASGKTPSAVSVTKAAAAKNSVTVTWKKSKYATSYRIYYKQAGAKKWTTLATISSKNLKYTHKSSKKYPLKGGKKYSYTVWHTTSMAGSGVFTIRKARPSLFRPYHPL